MLLAFLLTNTTAVPLTFNLPRSNFESPSPTREGVAKVTSASYLVKKVTKFAFIRVHLRTNIFKKKC
jgi:hypothetical protein